MRVVFDTNILIDYFNGQESAAKEVALHQDKLISIVTYIELLTGMRNEEERLSTQKFLSAFKVIDVKKDIADRAVEQRKVNRLKTPDATIYATAKVEGCLLVTRNTKDFKEEWPDVRVPYNV